MRMSRFSETAQRRLFLCQQRLQFRLEYWDKPFYAIYIRNSHYFCIFYVIFQNFVECQLLVLYKWCECLAWPVHSLSKWRDSPPPSFRNYFHFSDHDYKLLSSTFTFPEVKCEICRHQRIFLFTKMDAEGTKVNKSIFSDQKVIHSVKTVRWLGSTMTKSALDKES